MKGYFRTLTAAALVAALPFASASAQDSQIFKKGYSDIGAVIGLGNLGDASISVGGRFEKAIKDLPDLANGTLGIGVSADIYSYSNQNVTVRYIPIGATANYHFNLENKKIVPFVGLGLGLEILSCDSKLASGVDLCDDGSLYFIGRAGGRYFFSDRSSFYADIGAGAATVNVGLTFRIR